MLHFSLIKNVLWLIVAKIFQKWMLDTKTVKTNDGQLFHSYKI